MEQWQDEASQQVKLLTSRLNELLSKGLGLLRSELGVDLGLKPELIPPWVILLAACTGLVLMVALWASTCRSLFKKRPEVSPVDDDDIEIKRGVSKPVKSEEPKKKKKKAEKKTQPNGRAVAEPQEEAMVSEEIVPHHQPPPPEVKAGKVAELKKSKKKAKQAVKETKTVAADGKEPEGTWETKVSNKEKREQRKKDKSSSDGSSSPGGGDTPVSTPPEQPKASAALTSASQKKKKGESTKVKVEKVEAVVPVVNSSEVVVVVAAAVTDIAVKVPAPTVSPKAGPWTTSRESVSLWRAELDDSWTVIDRGMPTSEHSLVSLTGLGVGAAEPQPVKELAWLSQPRVDDEWSGLNGGSVDPSSDWNAPSEVWGNYEEPTPEPPLALEQPLPEPAKVNLLIGAADDDDEEEKDKGETAADGAAKTKKKKKKKKKAAEEGGTAGQAEEPEKEVTPAASVKKQENAAAVQPVKAAAVEARVVQPVKDNISQKPPVTQVPQKPTDEEPPAKQSNLSAPTQQKKPEESQAPKAAKKKKARRET